MKEDQLKGLLIIYCIEVVENLGFCPPPSPIPYMTFLELFHSLSNVLIQFCLPFLWFYMSEIFVKNILPILESKQKQITPDLLKKFTSNYLVKNDNHFSPTGNKL